MKKIKNYILIGLGVLSVILGLVCFGKNTGSNESNLSYGGDAYTGIQNASAQAANNTKYLAEICKFGFGSILLIAGGTLIVFGIPEPEEKAEQEPDAEVLLQMPGEIVSEE